MTFSPQTSKTYGKYSWNAARNINIVCFCFNLNICSEPHKHTVEKASVPKLWVLLISRVTHVNEIFNEVFLCLEQNLEVLVSLCLSMDRQTNISIHRAATYYLRLLQFGHCKGEEGKRLNSLISTVFEADCCLLSQCAAEVTVWWRHQNHIIHNKQKEKKKTNNLEVSFIRHSAPSGCTSRSRPWKSQTESVTRRTTQSKSSSVHEANTQRIEFVTTSWQSRTEKPWTIKDLEEFQFESRAGWRDQLRYHKPGATNASNKQINQWNSD